jgi:hypothetical protein
MILRIFNMLCRLSGLPGPLAVDLARLWARVSKLYITRPAAAGAPAYRVGFARLFWLARHLL